jgi:hypothetical protein
MEEEQKGLLRVGKVSSVDSANRKARVIFPGMNNMVSDWLPVLWFPGFTNTSDGSHQHSVDLGTSSGETDYGGTPSHAHGVTVHNGSATTANAGYHTHQINQWMPRVNDRVVVAMEYGFNAAGYILGVIP